MTDLPFFSTASSADGSLTVAIAAGKSSPPCMTDSYARILSAIKKLLPQIVLGQELSLLRYHPNSPAEGGRAHFCAQTMRTPLITDGVPVAPSLIQVRIALVSPFSRFSAAAIPPSAALFVRQAPAYYSYSSVSAFFLIICDKFYFVNHHFNNCGSTAATVFSSPKPLTLYSTSRSVTCFSWNRADKSVL